jgi:hypothetical protein
MISFSLGLPAIPDHGTRAIRGTDQDLVIVHLIGTMIAPLNIAMEDHGEHRERTAPTIRLFRRTATDSAIPYLGIRREDLVLS